MPLGIVECKGKLLFWITQDFLLKFYLFHKKIWCRWGTTPTYTALNCKIKSEKYGESPSKVE